MRKLSIIITTLFLLTCFAKTAEAQSPVNLGIKGGVNLANLSDSDADVRTGLIGGLAIDFGLPLMPLGIETGIYYSQKGLSNEANGATGTLKLDYLEVPLLAKFSLGPPGPISPSFVIGPYAGYLLNSEYEGENEFGGGTINFEDDTETVDFGLLAGVGVDFNLGLTKVNVQARYGYGLVDAFDDEDSKNRVLSITAGIMF
ncbi:MAG: porin family protein [Balneolaceae bacterium]